MIHRVLLFLGIVAFTFPVSAFAGWKVTRQIPLAGNGGWDYLTIDSPGQRLFVTHMNEVLVLDLATRKIVGKLAAAKAHGVALAPDLHRGFISNGDGNAVTIFDLDSLKPIQSVPVGQGPDAICYEPMTKRVLAFNGRDRSVSFIDAASGLVLGHLPLPGRPEFAQSDNAGHVFDNIEDKGLIVKIDVAQMRIVATWKLPPGLDPSALAIDRANHRLFSACGGGKLDVVDSDSGRVVATLPIGQGVDADAYDPAGKRVFASCGDGTLTVIRQEGPNQYAVEEKAATVKGARTMAFDSITQTAYLPTAKFGPAPAATPGHPHPRPSIVPGSFELLVVTRV